MPFQSEKQRRYLWANEPEIARDWTDTYGSGIARALGGRIPFAEAGSTKKTSIPKWNLALLKTALETTPNTPANKEKRAKIQADIDRVQGDIGTGADTLLGSGEAPTEGFWGSLAEMLGISQAEGAETGSAAEDQVRQEFFDYGTQQADIGDTAYSNLKVPELNVKHPDAPVNWSQYDDAESEWNAAQGFEDADEQAAYDAYVAGIPTLKNKWNMPNFNMPKWSDVSGIYQALKGSVPWGWGIQALNFMGGQGGFKGRAINPATRQFMNQYNVGRNPQTGRQIGGPFAGQNLPGMSMFGSKTPQEMAQKWMQKHGSRQYNTEKMMAKQKERVKSGSTREDPQPAPSY